MIIRLTAGFRFDAKCASPRHTAPASFLTAHKPLNSPAHVLIASLIDTSIGFFDFYVYATAAMLIFPTAFFPSSDPTGVRYTSVAESTDGFP
ncbi:hypothetical protein MMA231_02752 [Asticcacaulis sp. MM231]